MLCYAFMDGRGGGCTLSITNIQSIISGPALCNVTMERGGVEFSQSKCVA